MDDTCLSSGVVEVEPASKIHWSRDQRVQVLEAAKLIREEDPDISLVALIKRAQEIALDPRDWRTWRQYAKTKSNEWFHLNLGIEEPTPAVVEESRPVVKDASEETPPDDILGILQVLVETIREDREAAALGRETLFTALSRVTALEKELREVSSHISAIMTQGFVIRPLAGIPNLPVVEVEPVVQKPIIEVVRTSPNGSAKVRSPRVLVLNLDAHQKESVIKGTKGRNVDVDFLDAQSGKVPAIFADFDYIVCTKKTPDDLLHAAREIYGEKKVVQQPGNVHDRIIPRILSFSPVVAK